MILLFYNTIGAITLKNYFIIHGFKGSNIENWFPWLKQKIDDSNNLCIIPQFPIDDKHHIYSEWKKILDIYNKEYELMNENTIIIGHSTGSICALKYILENKIHIQKLILVSGFNNYLSQDETDLHNKLNPTYYVDESQISKINDYVKEIVCIYGDNDPYIPQETLKHFASSIKAKEIIIHNGGHLNHEAGYDSFNEILKEI